MSIGDGEGDFRLLSVLRLWQIAADREIVSTPAARRAKAELMRRGEWKGPISGDMAAKRGV